MLYKYIIWINLLFLSPAKLLAPKSADKTNETKKWIISENSNLCVNGSTNVNNFSCEILAYDQTDTLSVNKNKAGKEIGLSGCIKLKVQSFDCHNSIMTHDLQKTLKEKQFPVLRINFLSLSKLPDLTIRPESITGAVDIEIAGVRKRFEVNYQISADAQKNIRLNGSRDVNFSDFNLIPPRKLGGIIKTKDKLSVDFHLKMKSME